MSDEHSVDTTAANNVADAEKPGRKKASDRMYLDAKGEEADSPIGCSGFSYKSVPEGWTKTFTWDDFDDPQIKGLAAFGALTLIGNQTNRVRNGQVKEGGPTTELEAVDQWLENLQQGNWVTAGGDVEAGVNLLARAFVEAYPELPVVQQGIDAVKAKLQSVSKEALKKYRADARINVAINTFKLQAAKDKAAKESGAGITL